MILLFNDNAWGLLRQYQQTRNERYIASDLRNPDFTRLAEACGARALRAESLAELGPGLETALHSGVVTVVEVPTPDGFASFG